MATTINWRSVQTKLGVRADGIAGPITYGAIFTHMGAGAQAQALGVAAARHIGVIAANPLRLANWFGQMAHETGGFTKFTESLTYSSASRIRAVWPSRFPTDASAKPFVRNAQGLANRVYNGRMGNTRPNDGWTFRGRGIIHLTGRSMYELYGPRVGIDLVSNPDRAADPDVAVPVAIFYWNDKRLNHLADADNRREITRRINGGFNGLDDRLRRTTRALTLLS